MSTNLSQIVYTMLALAKESFLDVQKVKYAHLVSLPHLALRYSVILVILQLKTFQCVPVFPLKKVIVPCMHVSKALSYAFRFSSSLHDLIMHDK